VTSRPLWPLYYTVAVLTRGPRSNVSGSAARRAYQAPSANFPQKRGVLYIFFWGNNSHLGRVRGDPTVTLERLFYYLALRKGLYGCAGGDASNRKKGHHGSPGHQSAAFRQTERPPWTAPFLHPAFLRIAARRFWAGVSNLVLSKPSLAPSWARLISDRVSMISATFSVSASSHWRASWTGVMCSFSKVRSGHQASLAR